MPPFQPGDDRAGVLWRDFVSWRAGLPARRRRHFHTGYAAARGREGDLLDDDRQGFVFLMRQHVKEPADGASQRQAQAEKPDDGVRDKAGEAESESDGQDDRPRGRLRQHHGFLIVMSVHCAVCW